MSMNFGDTNNDQNCTLVVPVKVLAPRGNGGAG